MMDFDQYRPYILSNGCRDCKGRGAGDLCGHHRALWYQIKQLKAAIREWSTTAINIGAIKRASECNRCHQEVKLLPHHNDYNQPFEIEWLCYSCHAKHHSPDRVKAMAARKQDLLERAVALNPT